MSLICGRVEVSNFLKKYMHCIFLNKWMSFTINDAFLNDGRNSKKYVYFKVKRKKKRKVFTDKLVIFLIEKKNVSLFSFVMF